MYRVISHLRPTRIKLLLGLALVVIMSFVTGAPATAITCPTEEKPNGSLCVPNCASGQTYISIPLSGNEHCINDNSGSSDVTQNPIFTWIVAILSFMNVGVGLAVTGGIIYGAITYTTAGGNPAQTKKAIGIITNSIVSLILYIMLFAIVNFIVPGGVLK